MDDTVVEACILTNLGINQESKFILLIDLNMVMKFYTPIFYLSKVSVLIIFLRKGKLYLRYVMQ